MNAPRLAGGLAALAAGLRRKAWARLAGLLASGRCPLCAAVADRPGPCPACLAALTALPDDLCPGCGETLPAWMLPDRADQASPTPAGFPTARGATVPALSNGATETAAPPSCGWPPERPQPAETAGPAPRAGRPRAQATDFAATLGHTGADAVFGPPAPLLCPACCQAPRPWDALAFCGLYAGELRTLVLSFKFGAMLGRAELLAGLLHAAYLSGRGRPGGFDPRGPELVTGAPLHPSRLLRRGYNQSFELARLLAARLGVPASARAVTKTRATPPQARLDRAARHANLRGAFAADPALAGGRRVLVVDDVLTTGATLGEVCLALKAAGAARVEALVLAKDRKIRA